MDVFFDQLARLNQAQLVALRAAWNSTSPEALEDAWKNVRALGAREGPAKEIDRVRARALTWTSHGRNNIGYTMVDFWRQFQIEAGGAIVGAALAVALGSRLDSVAHDILIGPRLRAREAAKLACWQRP